MILATILLIVALNLSLGLIVFARDFSNKTNLLLFINTLLVACWIIMNYLSNETRLAHSASLIINHLVLFFGSLVVLSLNLLLQNMSPIYRSNKRQSALFLLGCIAGVLSLTDYVVESIKIESGLIIIVFGPLATLYFISLIYFIIRMFWLTLAGIRQSQGIQRARMQVVGTGVVIAFGVLLLTNVLLPSIFSYFSASIFGPLAFLALTVSFFYSIVKQRLFDITSTIMRALGYILSTTLLVCAYSIIIHSVNGAILNQGAGIKQEILSYGLIGLMVLLFVPTQKLINTLTFRIFYRQHYSTRQVINSVTDNISLKFDETFLLSKNISIINTAINSSYIIYVSQPSNKSTIFHGNSKRVTKSFKLIDKAFLDNSLYLRSDISHSAFDKYLADNEIDIIMPLDGVKERSGTLLFGPKRNGSAYSKQDIELLSVLRKTLSVAVQNARNYQEVVDFSETLKEKVADATAELAKANRELSDASTAKDEFLSIATHQIHPLLVAGRGFLDLLKSETEAVERKQLNDLATASLERMTRVISDMLNFSHYSAGKLNIRFESRDLADVVKSEVAAQTAFVETAGFTITCATSKEPILVSIDETKLREVIANFIHNAVQYGSHDNPKVIVSVSVKNKQALCHVQDFGVGIPKSEQRSIIKKFYRATNAQEKRPSGSGLGLFLADIIIKAHKGKLTVSSKEGSGSTFGFILPLI